MCKRIAVIAYDLGNEVEKGHLTPHQSEFAIVLNSGKFLDNDTTQFTPLQSLQIDSLGRQIEIPLKNPIKVSLKPLAKTTRPYFAAAHQTLDEMYPPSSNSWFARMRGQERATYYIHTTDEENTFWLIVYNSNTCTIEEAHIIRSYEAMTLILEDEWRINDKIDNTIRQHSETLAETWLDEMLNGPPPSWEGLARITQNLSIPNLQMGRTMKETLQILIPHEFPESIRTQLMALLAWAAEKNLPDEEPVEFFTSIMKLDRLPFLLLGHFQCILDGKEPPPYVEIINKAQSGSLVLDNIVRPEAAESASWNMAWYAIANSFPSWLDRIIAYADRMNKGENVTTHFPIDRQSAISSRKAWGDRLAMLVHRLQMSIHVFPQSLGLKQLVYLGSAHRWPHNHLAWMARLGERWERPPYVQVMIMPHTASEKVQRLRPNVSEVTWSMFRANLNLYNPEKKEWEMSVARLASSMNRERTILRLRNEFGGWRGSHPYKLNQEDARILDLASTGPAFWRMETEGYWHYWGIPRGIVEERLTELKKRGVINVTYLPRMPNLTTLFTFAQGKSMKICALVRGFLKYTPTTTAMVSKNGESCILLSRLPARFIHETRESLMSKSEEVGISVRCMRPSSFNTYRGSLYQRLLLEDGSFDSDVSIMLSQIRVPYRDIEAGDFP